MTSPTLEIAVDCPEFAARLGGLVDRLELCWKLDEEGWTPPPDLMAGFRSMVGGDVPMHVLIRPGSGTSGSGTEPGDFLVDEAGLKRSVEEVELAGRLGFQGVVVGPCTRCGQVDLEAMEVLCERARGFQLEVGFHRAFDLLEDRDEALDQLGQLGVCQVLSSGARGWSMEQIPLADRLDRLRALASRSDGRPGDPVRIVACGGVRATNAGAFLSATGHLHSSCRLEGRPDADEARALSQVFGRG